VTYQTFSFQIDAQASYKLNTRANSLDLGDEASLDASFQYRLWPPSLDDAGVRARAKDHPATDGQHQAGKSEDPFLVAQHDENS